MIFFTISDRKSIKNKGIFQYVVYLFISLYGYFLSIYYKDSTIVVTLLNFVLSKNLLLSEGYDE